jgi:NAD(P)H-flavin reductase
MMRFTAQGLSELGMPPGEVWVSEERNMHCAVAHCGRCQLGPKLVCRDGPVFAWPELRALSQVRGL